MFVIDTDLAVFTLFSFPSFISCNHLASYLLGESDGARGEAVVGGGGYFQIIQSLAAEFPLDIRLQHVVTKVRKGVGSGPPHWVADRVHEQVHA